MEFVRVLEDFDHLWAVQEPGKEFDELTALFEKWNDAGYLLEFFKDNFEDLKNYFKIALALESTNRLLEENRFRNRSFKIWKTEYFIHVAAQFSGKILFT